MALPVRFTTDTVRRDDGTTLDREVLVTTHPDRTESAMLATDRDREVHAQAYADFLAPEAEPSHAELLAEWRKEHPLKPPGERIAAARQARVDAETEAAKAAAAAAATPAPGSAPSRPPVVAPLA
jgi:hypothetical protein